MRNTGLAAQSEFERRWMTLGKDVVVHRFLDSADLTRERAARTGRSFKQAFMAMPEQPADFLVIWKHGMFLAEVKSTQSTRFAFSMLRKPQISMGIRATVARDGSYFIFIRHEPSFKWFKVPFGRVEETVKQGKSSIPLHLCEPWSLS